jgi:hypothetical protein
VSLEQRTNPRRSGRRATASKGRRSMRSSYLRVVPLYIHPFSELTLLQPCSVRIKLILALHTAKSYYLTCKTLHAAAINPRKPDRAASRPSILNLHALALLILKATGLYVTCELPQLFLGHHMA